jgi:peroxiredoxin
MVVGEVPLLRRDDMAVDSLMVPLGTPAPDFDLPTIDGGRVSLADIDSTVLVVMFLCNHCPYVKHVEGQLGEVVDSFAGDDVTFVGICSNDADAYPDDGPDGLRDQATRAGWDFPYAIDDTQDVAREYRAACTPDFFVYGPDRTLVYRGAMDDSSPGNGEPLTGSYLRDAISRTLNGEVVPNNQKPSMGCSIKWRE